MRRAVIGDAEALFALYDLLDDQEPAADYPHARDELRNYLQQLSQIPGSAVWVKVDEERILGTYTLIVLPLLVHGGRRIAVLESVVVGPNERGKGLGAELMRHAADQAKGTKAYKLMLSSNLRRHAAHEFYEHIGFEKHGFSFYLE